MATNASSANLANEHLTDMIISQLHRFEFGVVHMPQQHVDVVTLFEDLEDAMAPAAPCVPYPPSRTYPTAFKRHLAYYDRDGDGLIYFGDSLRAHLSLGLDFPVALIGAIGIQSIYGNARPIFFGPFNVIDMDRVSSQRNMLENVELTSAPSDGLERKALLASSGATGLLDRMHVNGLWALAANKQGKLSVEDIRKFQDGRMLFDLEKRRKDRSDVLPLRRGGPISVTGHSWFVDKLFGVKVYRVDSTPLSDKKE